MASLAHDIGALRSTTMDNVSRLDADTAWAAFMRRDRSWDGKILALMLPAAALGIAMAYWFAASLPEPGMQMANAPAASTSSRVCVCLSITMAMRGGVNSTGMDQAAAMTLRRPAWALVTSTVGPWFTRRLACSGATGWKCGFMQPS